MAANEIQNKAGVTDQTTNHGSTDAADSNHLLHAFLSSDGKTTDRAARPSDMSGARAAVDKVPVQPNVLIAQAQSAAKEVVQLLKSGAPSTDVVHYTDSTTGQVKETTVGDRLTQLKTEINTDSQNAIAGANAIDQKAVATSLDQNSSQLAKLAKPLGLDPSNPTFEATVARAAQANPNDQNLQQLTQLAQQREQLNSERLLPALSRFSYANLMADGLTDNPAQSLKSVEQTGQPQPSAKEISDSYLLLGQAGRLSSDAQNSPEFQQLSQQVSGQYTQMQEQNSQQLSTKIATELTTAKQQEAAGQTDKANQTYQQVMKDASSIDLNFIAAQLRIPTNQNNPEVAQALTNIITGVSGAKLDYANFLNKQGKFSEALPLALQVAADTPQVAQQDQSFNQILQKAEFGNSMSSADTITAEQKFAQLMQEKNYSAAEQELDKIKSSFQSAKTAIDSGDAALDKEKTSITQQLKDLDAQKASMNPTEYQIAQQRLTNQQQAIDAIEKQNQAYVKQGAYYQYLSGVVDASKGDNNAAHQAFLDAKAQNPDLEKNAQLNLDKYIDATKPQSWFQKHWDTIAHIGAVAAGVVVGVAVGCLTGPGGIAAGIGTTAAITAAVGGGFVAGGLAFSGIKAAAGQKVGLNDFVTGGFDGALSAVPFAAGGGALLGGTRIAAEAGGEALTGTAAADSALSAAAADAAPSLMSRVGAQAAKFGFTKAGLITGTGLSGAQQAWNVGYNHESLGDAAKNFAMGSVFNSWTIGMGARAFAPASEFAEAGLRAPSIGNRVFNGSMAFAGTGAGQAVIGDGVGAAIRAYRGPFNYNNPQDAASFEQSFDSVNPSLFAPTDNGAAQPQGDSTGSSSTPPADQQTQAPMSQAEIARLSAQPIEDEPVNGN